MGGGQSQPTTTTQIQKTELPAWVDAASQKNYAFAEDVANRPFQQYTGQRVAGMSSGELAAPDTLQAGVAGSSALYNRAAQALSGIAGGVQAPQVRAPTSFMGVNDPGATPMVGQMQGVAGVQNKGGYMGVTAPGAVGNVADPNAVAAVQGGQGFMSIGAPAGVRDVAQFAGARDVTAPQNVANVNARSFLDADVQKYMNPYTQNVIDTTRSGMMRDESTALQKNADANRASGAWGGSRDAVSNAVIQSEGIRNRAATEAGLRSAAFTNAQSQINTDNAAFMQAGLANQQKDITGNAQRLQAEAANQSADMSKGQLNANIGVANQQKDITGNAQALDAAKANQSSFLANAAQRLSADQGNQSTAAAMEQLRGNIGIANQSSQNTAAARALSAAQGNQQSFLSANQQDLAAQQANQNSALATQGTNASLLQGNQQAVTQNNAQRLSAQQANQSAGLNLAQLGVSAQQANQNAALQGTQLGLSAAQGLGALGTDVTNTAGKNALLQSQLGANERAVNQAGLDAEQQKWLEQYNAPVEALNTRLAALGMSPYGKTTSTTETKQGGTSSNTGLSVLGGIMSFLPLMFSDKNVKTDVKKLGKIPGHDLNAYEYRYKDSFMSGSEDQPKQIGLMAQEVEKKVPGAVKKVKVGKKSVRAVDYGKAMAGSRKGTAFMSA